ncbi:MAG: magnesium transporter [candidate division KSB1 bacterium]|nr:magnesium transporter [candidate division KSB1 bacterium]MDZ7293886.1 magnesium transporter [candidate division KSB1 bacterium]MDZ7384714.1 magnesium transporter [candidate division KSB1 bacterium]MDZ7392283.1 magnesium transporter [candidate division KSB1 bacterium]
MLKELLLPEIKELIDAKDWRTLKQAIVDWPTPDIADLLESLHEADRILLFRLLPRQQAAEVFAYFEPDKQHQLLQRLTNEQVKALLEEVPPDDRTELFEELPGKVTQQLINLLSPEERREALQLLGYPEESVGRLMTPDYVAICSHWTIEQAIAHIRRHGKDAETINVIYVVDDDDHLVDDLPIRRVILADPQEKVESIMDHKYVAIEANADQEEAIRLIQHYDLSALPVVDKENVLLGIVTVDDVLDVLQEEVTEDVHKGASITPLESTYEAASFWSLYRKRVGWLSLLAVAGFLSSSVIALYEETLAKIVALAFFIPVLIDSGGNTGSQSATLIIRALALGELTPKRWFQVVRKELLVGLLLGATLGIILFVWGEFWKGGPQVGVVVGLSMVCIIFISNLLGSLLPIVMTKIRLDPAVVSSPLITTLIDALGLFIYFTVAKLVLKF